MNCIIFLVSRLWCCDDELILYDIVFSSLFLKNEKAKDKFYVVATNIHTNKKTNVHLQKSTEFKILWCNCRKRLLWLNLFLKKRARIECEQKIYEVSKHEFIQLSFILCLPVLCTILRLWKQITWDSLRNIRTTIKCDFTVY